MKNERKDEILRALFARVAAFEEDRLQEALEADGITKEEAAAYGIEWDDEEDEE